MKVVDPNRSEPVVQTRLRVGKGLDSYARGLFNLLARQRIETVLGRWYGNNTR